MNNISSKKLLLKFVLLITYEVPNFSHLTFFIYNIIFVGFGKEVASGDFALPKASK
jgi:hypothetical protein